MRSIDRQAAAQQEERERVKALARKKIEEDIAKERALLDEDEDDTKWTSAEGRGPFTGLKEKLEDLKVLYTSKFGVDFDDGENSDRYWGEDGTASAVSEGTGPLSGLDERLGDLKALHKTRFGVQFEGAHCAGCYEDEDGAAWTLSEGRGPFTGSDDKFEDLKVFYRSKF